MQKGAISIITGIILSIFIVVLVILLVMLIVFKSSPESSVRIFSKSRKKSKALSEILFP